VKTVGTIGGDNRSLNKLHYGLKKSILKLKAPVIELVREPIDGVAIGSIQMYSGHQSTLNERCTLSSAESRA
jgi:hypothetical protein